MSTAITGPAVGLRSPPFESALRRVSRPTAQFDAQLSKAGQRVRRDFLRADLRRGTLFAVTMLRFGDLLKTPRGLYAHYGVYFADDMVLEFAGDRAKDVATARPRWSTLARFADGCPVHVVQQTSCQPAEIYARAVEVQNGAPRYNLYSFNCEHLARYVMSGQRVSTQSNNATWLLLAAIVWRMLPD